jgi:NAD(P)-dependent dehydrogenase (short-subunit alcohol dehydrogenase family)
VSGLPDLAGRVAVVTGGGSGIGRALAQRLGAEGMRIVIADVEAEPLARAAAELGAVALPVDVADRTSVEALAAAVTDRFGAVHVLCNNAGVASTAAIADTTADDWRWILGVNLWGVINGVAAFLPVLERNPDGGHIVNTASVAAFSVTPLHGAYCATKHAVIAFTETLALELEQSGSQVGVTALCPGPVSTNLGASSRNRPPQLSDRGLVDADLESDPERGGSVRWIAPEDVAAIVPAAIRNGDLYAITHAEHAAELSARYERIRAAFERAPGR